jgi:hypothetical protein
MKKPGDKDYMSINSVKKRLRKIEIFESDKKENQITLLTREPTEEERKQGGYS